MAIKEMVEKSPCCMKFLQELLKLDEEPSKEKFISVTENCCFVQDFHIPKEEGDPGCFNVPVSIGNNFVGEALCYLGANSNLMSLSTFNRFGGLNLRPCFMDIGLADGGEAELAGMVIHMMIDIDGFKFKINVIVSKNEKKQDFPLIFGRSFLATAKALIDL